MLSLVTKHESPLTADFPRFYGQRLLTALTELPHGELLDMIQWLPGESAFHASVRANGDVEHARAMFGWTNQEELLLGLFNRLSENTWVTAQVSSKKKIPRPKMAESPGSSSRRKEGSASMVARSLLDQQKG